MGNVYVWLDKGLKHETENILGVNIHSDFQDMNRRELCQHIANKFGWEKDAFWNLESTQKIRLCCQQARNMERPRKLDPEIVETSWRDVQKNREVFQGLFGNANFMMVNNNDTLSEKAATKKFNMFIGAITFKIQVMNYYFVNFAQDTVFISVT